MQPPPLPMARHPPNTVRVIFFKYKLGNTSPVPETSQWHPATLRRHPNSSLRPEGAHGAALLPAHSPRAYSRAFFPSPRHITFLLGLCICSPLSQQCSLPRPLRDWHSLNASFSKRPSRPPLLKFCLASSSPSHSAPHPCSASFTVSPIPFLVHPFLPVCLPFLARPSPEC